MSNQCYFCFSGIMVRQLACGHYACQDCIRHRGRSLSGKIYLLCPFCRLMEESECLGTHHTVWNATLNLKIKEWWPLCIACKGSDPPNLCKRCQEMIFSEYVRCKFDARFMFASYTPCFVPSHVWKQHKLTITRPSTKT